jgi:hypothetical protein
MLTDPEQILEDQGNHPRCPFPIIVTERLTPDIVMRRRSLRELDSQGASVPTAPKAGTLP